MTTTKDTVMELDDTNDFGFFSHSNAPKKSPSVVCITIPFITSPFLPTEKFGL